MESNYLSYCSKLVTTKTYKLILIGIGLFIITSSSYCNERYFLCGPDENGCSEDSYQYCTCTPYNNLEANKLYCFDFDNLSCTPVSQTPNCDPSLIFNNQGECLATIFQSEPFPPCSITTHAFCLEHHSKICNPDGEPNSCH